MNPKSIVFLCSSDCMYVCMRCELWTTMDFILIWLHVCIYVFFIILYIKNSIYKKTLIFFKFTLYPTFPFPTFWEKCRFSISISYQKHFPFPFLCNLAQNTTNMGSIHTSHNKSLCKLIHLENALKTYTDSWSHKLFQTL